MMKIYIYLTVVIVCNGLMDQGSRRLQFGVTNDVRIHDNMTVGNEKDHGSDDEGVIAELDIAEGDTKDIEHECVACGDNTGSNNTQTQNGANFRGNSQDNISGRNRGSQRNGGWRTRGNDSRDRKKRAAVRDTRRYWPDKTLIYAIEGDFSVEELAVIAEALDEFKKFTCIKIKERTTETKYVRILRDHYCCCSSDVGYIFQSTYINKLNLGTHCVHDKKTPIHELMHTLGVIHQHSRPDMDDYITINYQHIDPGPDGSNFRQFKKFRAAEVEHFNIPYSYNSIMHYPKDAGSSHGSNTISASDPSNEDLIRRGPTFSYEDVQLLSAMYSCNAGCGPDNCPEGSFQGKDCLCYCRSNDPDVPVNPCGPGDWCVDLKFRTENAYIDRDYQIYDSELILWHAHDDGYGMGHSGLETWGTAETERFNLPSGKRMKVRVQARAQQRGPWKAAIDAIKIQKC